MATKKTLKDYNQPLEVAPAVPANTPAYNPTAPLKKNFTPAPTPTPAPTQNADNGIPKIIHDQNTGDVTGVIINGKTMLGLTPREVQFLVDKHYARTANPQGTVSADAQPNKTLSTDQQIIQEELAARHKADVIASITPPNISQEQSSNIGQIDMSAANQNDSLTASIQQNLNNREKTNTPIAYQTGEIKVPFFNKLTAGVNQIPVVGGLTKSVITILSNDRSVRDYWNDYSNEDNLNSIRDNIITADAQINAAIASAKFDENTPENVKRVTDIYNGAQTRKYKSIQQLKMIAAGDQRRYTDSIKDDLTALELYFNGDKITGAPAGKKLDDNALYGNLNKPSPKYLQNSGGVQ